MLESILTAVKTWCEGVIGTTGYFGIVSLMTLESACIPIPSEAIMTVGGVVAHQGKLNFHLVVFAGAFGNLLGSALTYWVGARGGRNFMVKYGKYILVRAHDLEVADRWFHRWGNWAAFIARMLPIIRTFISFPAGVHRVPLLPFLILSFVGSVPWCYFLTYVGYYMSKKWETIKAYMHEFELVITVLLVLGVGYYIYRHLKPEKPMSAEEKA